MSEALDKVAILLDKINQEQRLEALDKMPALLQALAPPQDPMPPMDVQGEGHTIIVNNNPGGNNDISFGKGGWVSRKTGTGTSKARSGEFKVQENGPYFGKEWVKVYDYVRSITGVWSAEQSDGNLMPPHNGKEWGGKGKSLGLHLGTGVDCPDTYIEVGQDELRFCSGPAGTRLGLRKPVYTKAVELGLIVVKAAADAPSDTTDSTPQPEATEPPKKSSLFTI
jgi:hypothetical protein